MMRWGACADREVVPSAMRVMAEGDQGMGDCRRNSSTEEDKLQGMRA